MPPRTSGYSKPGRPVSLTDPFLVRKAFKGINNQDPPSALDNEESTVAVNVEIDNVGSIGTRKGTVQLLDGEHRDMFVFNDTLIGVTGTSLVRMDIDASTPVEYEIKAGLTPGARMSYCIVNDVCYAMNGHDIGMIGSDLQWYDLPDVDFGEPKPHVREYLRGTKQKMPSGEMARYYNGRLITCIGNKLIWSDPNAFHRNDLAKGFAYMVGDITMIEPVIDGVWVSDGSISFIAGQDIAEGVLQKKAPYPAIYGASVVVDGGMLGVDGMVGDAVVFHTTEGICIGAAGGRFINITEKKYKMSNANRANSAYAVSTGKNQVITIMK